MKHDIIREKTKYTKIDLASESHFSRKSNLIKRLGRYDDKTKSRIAISLCARIHIIICAHLVVQQVNTLEPYILQ